MRYPAPRIRPTPHVVVRVNGSHLIKNYLITFLALISYAWFSLSRASRPPTATSFFSLALSLSARLALTSILLYTLTLWLLLPPSPTPSFVSTLRSHLLAGEISVLVAVLFSSFSLYPSPSLFPSLQHPFFFRRISNHRRANFPAYWVNFPR